MVPWQPPEDVGAHHPPPVGVDGPARPDQPVPPARGRVARARRPGDVAVAGQGVLDQYRVGAVGVRLAPGLVGHRDRPEPAAQLQGEGGVAVEELGEPAPARGVPGLPGRSARVLLTA